MRKISLAMLALAALMFFLVRAACAVPTADAEITAEAAAMQLGAAYGVEIDLPVNTVGRVTMPTDNGPGTRLQSVNALANALGLDFTKTYVIGKTSDVPALMPKVDSMTLVPFGKTTLPVGDAISLVAGVDDASALVAGDVTGTVTLSAATLPAAQAAQEIAEQTKTSWRTIYVLAPRSGDPSRDGRLVGRTTSGTPIFLMPAIYFIDWKKDAQIRREQEAAAQQAEQAQATAEQQATLRSAGGSGDAPNGYGYGMNGDGAAGGPYADGSTGVYGPNNGLTILGNGH